MRVWLNSDADISSRTLSGMFPDLDKEVIDDVVREKEGRYVQSPFDQMQLKISAAFSFIVINLGGPRPGGDVFLAGKAYNC